MVLPHVRGPEALVAALIRLGASAQPNDRHWHGFFDSSDVATDLVSAREKQISDYCAKPIVD